MNQPAQATAFSERGQRLFDRLAALPFPSAAVISGPCLGGALEFALAGDYRLVVDDPKTQFGLPEVELGLLPGWGGTQRLPRTVGLERALQITLGGKRLSAKEAVAWGLTDALLTSVDEPLPESVRKAGKKNRSGLPLFTWRQKGKRGGYGSPRAVLRATSTCRISTADSAPILRRMNFS